MAIIAKTGNIKSSSTISVGKFKYFDRSDEYKFTNKYEYDGEYVIVPSEGNYSVQYVNGKFSHHQKTYRLTCDELLVKYLYYFLLSNKNVIISQGNGTTVKRYNCNLYNNLKLPNINFDQQQKIIDIIEPFEIMRNSLQEINNKILSILKNIELEKTDLSFSQYVEKYKNKKDENIADLLDLSSINSSSLTLCNYKNISDFNTNQYSIKKGDFFLTSIRPNLDKLGIAPKDLNILGTIHTFRLINYNDLGIVLCNLVSEDFKKHLIKYAKGTKMPVISWNDILTFKISVPKINSLSFFENIYKTIIANNLKLEILNKIIDNLINLYIQ